jgi:membrane dipeptidase
VDRRQFVTALGASGFWLAQGAPALPYDRWVLIDALASPQSFNIPWPPQYQGLTEEQRTSIRESGMTAINLTVNAATVEETVGNIAFWMGEVERHPDLLTVVRQAKDIAAAKESHRLGLMFGFQGTDVIEGDINRLTLFRRLGVRIMQLTYNTRSLVGDGCLEPGNAGLSTFGRSVVARMNELGIAVDLGHCGMQTCLDTIAVSKKPVLITHSGCRTIYNHPRNKTDEVLKALAARNGVIGIYLMPFLGGGTDGTGSGAATKELLLRHIDHAVKLCGVDRVGIGSDQSITPIRETPEYLAEWQRFSKVRQSAGAAAPGEDRPLYIAELNTPRRLESIGDALLGRGYKEDDVRKILGGNFQTALQGIWS